MFAQSEIVLLLVDIRCEALAQAGEHVYSTMSPIPTAVDIVMWICHLCSRVLIISLHSYFTLLTTQTRPNFGWIWEQICLLSLSRRQKQGVISNEPKNKFVCSYIKHWGIGRVRLVGGIYCSINMSSHQPGRMNLVLLKVSVLVCGEWWITYVVRESWFQHMRTYEPVCLREWGLPMNRFFIILTNPSAVSLVPGGCFIKGLAFHIVLYTPPV